MYTVTNYKTKKALKQAVADGNPVRVYQAGPYGCPDDGEVSIEGPHYPEPHRWYARATLVDGLIVKVT